MKSFIFCLLLLASWVAYPLEVLMTVDSNEAELEDILNLEVSVKDTQEEYSLQIENTNAFKLSENGRSSNIQIVNNHRSISQTSSYELIPKQIGDFEIGPAVVTVQGKKYYSNKILLSVKKNKKPSNAGTNEHFMAEALISHKSPYVGQNIIYTFRLYARANLLGGQFELPEFTGFSKEELGKQKRYSKVINGLEWEVIEVNLLLIPLKSGNYKLEPARVQGQINVGGRGNSFGFFGDAFFGERKKIQVRSNEIDINVKSVPNPPATFSGLIGKYSLNSRVDKTTIKKGDSINLSLSIAGSGNLENFQFPKFENTQFKIYEDKPEIKKEIRDGELHLEKTFKLALVPTHVGKTTLPNIKIEYFDTSTAQYKVLSSPEINLEVEESLDSNGNVLDFSRKSPDDVQTKPGIEFLAKDIVSIKLNPSSESSNGLINMVLWTSVFILPLIYIFLLVLGLLNKSSKRHNLDKRRSKAFKTLKNAIEEVSSDVQSSQTCFRIFKEYVASKLKIDASSLTPLDIQEQIKLKTQNAELNANITLFLKEVEKSIYGQEAKSLTDLDKMKKQAIELALKLEKIL